MVEAFCCYLLARMLDDEKISGKSNVSRTNLLCQEVDTYTLSLSGKHIQEIFSMILGRVKTHLSIIFYNPSNLRFLVYLMVVYSTYV